MLTRNKTQTDTKSNAIWPWYGEAVFDIISKYRLALMGLSALWILMFHTWQPIFIGRPYWGSFETYIKNIGFVGVDIFFFLSGMGLVFSIEKNHLLKFYWQRFKKLIVPSLISAYLIAIEQQWSQEETLKILSGYYFFTQDIYRFLWFLYAIILVYLSFPLYYKLFKISRHQVIFTCLAILGWYLASRALIPYMREDFFGFTNRIPVILVGCLLGWLGKEKKGPRVTWRSLLISLMLLVLGFWLAYLTTIKGGYFLLPVSNAFAPNFLIALNFSYLLCVLFSLSLTVISRFFSWFGKFSLELYVVQEWLWRRESTQLIENGRAAWQINLNFFIYVIALAYALYLLNQAVWYVLDKLNSLRPVKNKVK